MDGGIHYSWRANRIMAGAAVAGASQYETRNARVEIGHDSYSGLTIL
jgi:hypothetical protein